MSTTATTSLTGTWSVDPTHSSLRFAVRHMNISTFRGEVADFSASAVGDEDGLTLTGAGRVASIVTRDPALTAHIGAPDFFDAERHPEIRLEPARLEVDGDRVRTDAMLAIKGVSRPVELAGTISGPVTDPFGGTRIGLTLETTVDRRDFGLNFALPMPAGGVALGWKVRLTAELELVRED
jgi:polyisoprenoid-binding protein YceI